MLIRSVFLSAALSLVGLGQVAQAEEIPQLGDLEGLVVETLRTNYALRLTQGNFVNCERSGSISVACGVENGVLRLDLGGQHRALSVNRVVRLELGSGSSATVQYVFRAKWQEDINGFSVDTPVSLVVNYREDQPENLSGYIKAVELDVSHQVLVKRVAR